ncbi:MAG TPA: DNA polymerase III subunit gamma/tau [Desulfuromonadales bacterium]|nr:DNA polymerase III subunit gamma/tau [Desulfuromonadales bacterium]
MAYLVLARKWRPQNFPDLVGQEHVSRTLTNAIRSGRVHHAFLFTGARGVGKTSAARILAKALNCEQGPTDQPCNSCPVCNEITTGQGMDVLEIDGASNTGVDDIRELRENIRYLPSRSRFKIFIIDEVHMLSTSAFNALLKTLEEPPEHAKFIFATTEPHKIPVTILSRCQRFDFRKIPLQQIVARLRQIADAEGLEISDRSLGLVARRGEGSMRDALSTLDQVIAFCGESIDDEDVQALLGMVDRRLLLDTLEAVLQRDSRRLLDLIRQVDNLGHGLRQYVQELVELFRGLVICKAVAEPGDLLDLIEDELKELRKLAEPPSLEDLQRVITLLMKTQTELAGSPYPLLTLEMALIRIATLAPTQEVGRLIQQLEHLEKRLAGGTGQTGPAPERSRPAPAAPPPPGEPPPKKPEAPVAAETDHRDWQGLVEQVRQSRPMLASVLEHGRLLHCEPPGLEIGYPADSFLLVQLQDPDNCRELESLAASYFKQKMTLTVTPLDGVRQDAPPSLVETRQAKETDRMRRLREDAMAHPALKAVQEIFGGEIINVTPTDKGFV